MQAGRHPLQAGSGTSGDDGPVRTGVIAGGLGARSRRTDLHGAQVERRGPVGVATDEPLAVGIVNHRRLTALDDGLVQLAQSVPGEGGLLIRDGAGDEPAGVVVPVGVGAAGPGDRADGVGTDG